MTVLLNPPPSAGAAVRRPKRICRTALRNGCDVLVHEALIPAWLASRPMMFQRFAAKYDATTAQLADLARQAKPRLLIIYDATMPDVMFADMSKRYSGQFIVGRDLEIY